jgi:hypothetical protein
VANFKRYSQSLSCARDLVRRPAVWGKEFFGPTACAEEVPILPSIGNHESDGKITCFIPSAGPGTLVFLGPRTVTCWRCFQRQGDRRAVRLCQTRPHELKGALEIVFLHYPVFNIGGAAPAGG